jgi:hypothetical protein
MKPRKIFSRLTPLVIAALLLSSAAPDSYSQRRSARTRTRPRPTQRTRRSAPRPTPAQAQAAPTPASRPAANVGARPAEAAPRADEQQQRRTAAQDERSFEEMVSADAYGAYVELRRVGTLAQSDELKTAVAGLRLFGDAETKPLTDLVSFVSDNYEPLAEARVVVLFMAARPRIPQGIFAIEFPTPEAAAAFEPKYRRLADEQVRAYKLTKGPKDSTERETPAPPRPRGQKPEPKPPADYALRRVGRLLISSDTAVSLKRLRGDESAPSLADSARFQTARTRFASDSLFVYVDTGVTMQGWSRIGQVEGEQSDGTREGAKANAPSLGATDYEVATPTVLKEEAAASPTPEPPPQPTEEATPEPEELQGVEDEAVVTAELEAVKPSEEQLAAAGMGNVLRNLWGGMPRIPGAFALGARLEAGAVAVRLAVENSPDGKINVIPFLPNIVAGPPVTAEAAEVAPADADVFFTTTLDWEQVYTSTLGTASTGSVPVVYNEGGEPSGASEEKTPTPDQMIEAAEKVFGFKFREDLLPSLGSEIAVSMPLDSSELGLGPSRRRVKKDAEKDSEPGFVVIVSLRDPDKLQKIFPRVMAALGMASFGDQASQPERREGFEIRATGGLAYTFIDRFLVMGDAGPVRHVVDSYAARRTLASTESYRDSTRWQAPQKLVQAFVSESLMRATVEDTKARSGGSTDPVVRALLSQLEAPPEAASFVTTNEGDAVVHEVRVPVSLIQTYALAIMVGVRDAPVLTNESTATYALYELQNAEAAYKDEKKKGRYGTLEELTAEKLLDKGFGESASYRFELNASSDKFDITATPKEYGKTGRRSFFLDETGTMRAADHKGKPATASDPPVD